MASGRVPMMNENIGALFKTECVLLSTILIYPFGLENCDNIMAGCGFFSDIHFAISLDDFLANKSMKRKGKITVFCLSIRPTLPAINDKIPLRNKRLKRQY